MLDLLAADAETAGLPAQAGALTDYELFWRITDLTLNGTTARCRLDLVLIPAGASHGYHRKTVSQTAEAGESSEHARALALVQAARGCARQAAGFMASAATPPE